MRLLHVFTVPLSLRFLRGQIEFMRSRGVELHVACAEGPLAADFESRTGVPVHAIPIERPFSPASDLHAVAATTRLIRHIRPEVVHAHTPKGGLVGMLAAAAASVPRRIYHMRGLPYLTARGPMRRALWTTESTSCALAHRVIAVSPSLASAARRARFIGHEKIRVLAKGSSNGVDSVRFRPGNGDPTKLRADLGVSHDAPIVAYIGRLVRDKGIPELVAAWRTVSARHPKARLLLVGPLEARDALPGDLVEAIEREPTMIRVPFTEDVASIYAACSVVVLPTHREGFPNVPLEAAAMGRPVVTTDAVGAVDSVVDGVTGLIVPKGSVAPLARAIQSYLSDPVQADAHGSAGRTRAVADFSPQSIWRELHREYERG